MVRSYSSRRAFGPAALRGFFFPRTFVTRAHEFAADLLGRFEQFGQMAEAPGVHDPLGSQQEHELAELVLVGRQVDGVEDFVGRLVGPLVIEPGLPH